MPHCGKGPGLRTAGYHRKRTLWKIGTNSKLTSGTAARHERVRGPLRSKKSRYEDCQMTTTISLPDMAANSYDSGPQILTPEAVEFLQSLHGQFEPRA
jgi:hypothetical protein